jgi:DNA-binding response OmpR family regulator
MEGGQNVKVLVVEDEPAIASVVRRGLEQARYQVEVASDGAYGLELALAGNYGLIVLDLMLPQLDGMQVCAELRAQRCRTPILMLTARGEVLDRVKGLEAGADDYLAKPFEFIELLARARALIRRDKVHKASVFRVADLEVDTGRHRVTRAGREIALSPREYTLLEALASHEGQVLTREAIQDRVWMDEDAYSNTVDVYVGLLRKKVDAESDVKLIHTVRGAGYTLRRPDPEARR